MQFACIKHVQFLLIPFTENILQWFNLIKFDVLYELGEARKMTGWSRQLLAIWQCKKDKSRAWKQEVLLKKSLVVGTMNDYLSMYIKKYTLKL